MALLNNFLELRSDAFKMTVHNRRPIPARTDTIGPWLDTLTFLTWLSALTNSALVYLFCPRSQSYCSATPSGHTSQLDKVHQHLFSASGTQAPDDGADQSTGATRELLMTALLIALAASHGYMIIRVIIRHVVEMLVWKGSDEVKEREREERDVKEKFLTSVVGDEEARNSVRNPAVEDNRAGDNGESAIRNEEGTGFWDNDEGLEEIMRVSKEV